MEPFRIKILNAIAPEGLSLLDNGFLVGPDIEDPHGILVRSSKLDTDEFPSLLAVARAGAGVNNISVEKATAQGICVFNTPGANANAVAELVFTMLGLSARNLHHAVEFCLGLGGLSDEEISQQVEGKKAAFRGVELAGKTLGVIGLGKIGALVANGGVLRQMKVIGYDPFPILENIHALLPEVNIARSLHEMLSHVDILSLHVPLTEKTRHFADQELISQLPAGTVLVNYSRGPIVDEEAVIRGLDSGQLGRYITDFPTRALLENPAVLTSPHLGASTEESEEHCACMAAGSLKRYLQYGTISRSVNFPTAESIPARKVHTRLIMINRDVPDMIGFVSHTIGSFGINIASYLNESNGTIGYNIIDLEEPLSSEVIAAIEAHEGVLRTRSLVYKRA